MSKILYGVAGQGAGHSIRSYEVISYLKNQGHDVKIVSHDTGFENLSKDFEVEEIAGLNFYYKNNQVKYFRTLLVNQLKFFKLSKGFKKIVKIINSFQPDVVITDFEPLTALAANYKKVKLLSIDNQHTISNAKIEVPKKYFISYFLARLAINLIIPKASAYFSISFFFPKVTHKKTRLFHPIVRSDIYKLATAKEDYIFVYSTSKAEKLSEVLKKTDQKYIIYGYDKEEVDGNLTYRKADKQKFAQELARAKAVIASAGFTLISEALYLKKPYLAIPVEKQFEQIVNAYYLKKLGYGNYFDEIDLTNIKSFIDNIDKYNAKLANYKSQDNSKLLEAVESFVLK